MLLPLLLSMTQANFRAEAQALTQSIQERFWDPTKSHYAANVSEQGQASKKPAFAWDMAVQLSALAAATAKNPTYQNLFDQADASLQTYGSQYNGVFGYAVLPRQKQPDRYYDDNEWIALAQLDAFDATKDIKYLNQAVQTFKFVMSGESNELGGGIYWREKEKKSKNTCSNAPAIAIAARLYMAADDPGFLKTAVSLHNWVEQLKDSKDNLMFDAMSLDGKIEKRKWTYNTALMIRSDLLLYQATRQEPYLTEAIQMAIAAKSHWVDKQTGAIHDEGNFAHHLAEAFLVLEPYDKEGDWRNTALKAIQYAYTNGSKQGLFGKRWDRYEAPDQKLILLWQASMARALWLASE
ncbi:MAG TPA: glycoside hydrolase family 76 protein [Fimbriimonadaceae bacterium]|jgi:predicted alpha-1,6-mannanase (GH76 family)